MILWWVDDFNYLKHIENKDGSVRLFETLKEADEYANKHEKSGDLRVITIEGVNERKNKKRFVASVGKALNRAAENS